MEALSGYFESQSPAYEPISPPLRPAQLPKTSPGQNGKKDTHKVIPKLDTSKSGSGALRSAQKAAPVPQTEGASAEPSPAGRIIKNEEVTPKGFEEAGDATAGESVQSRVLAVTDNVSHKRKREDNTPGQAPPTSATHVEWTRAFHKISMTALDQIIGHRHANMFAHPIKPRTAPGYYEIVLRPQDLKGIQKAITAGSKAASAAVASMPAADVNAAAVWLPISVDLVPPRGIINIAQLERELVHMFANAIMYNPDPLRGLGPSFLKSYRSNSNADGEDTRGYEVDENGVVKDTRNMFAEVDKLLGDLRNEVVPRAHVTAGSRSMSVAGGEQSTAEDEADEQAGDAKRRRVRS
ncbi:Uu.00g073960.m01.CDS01 [Anthostomella pinea]|uniref:Uu.00g073960.m01.CDS01 n=1 Tax=Anthostomella pinea TaxID=933095 RepID=A0AAI8VPR7_9PEZI|nr:Uu.00g073960.m01.CDS01 [Anthostomella pinea]